MLEGLASDIAPDISISDITLDSRGVKPGAAFIAVPGLRNDSDFRTNIGFSEVSGSSGVVQATFYDALGVQVGQSNWT